MRTVREIEAEIYHLQREAARLRDDYPDIAKDIDDMVQIAERYLAEREMQEHA